MSLIRNSVIHCFVQIDGSDKPISNVPLHAGQFLGDKTGRVGLRGVSVGDSEHVADRELSDNSQPTLSTL